MTLPLTFIRGNTKTAPPETAPLEEWAEVWLSPIKNRTRAGEMFLEETYGGAWDESVDYFRLHMRSNNMCLLAQVEGVSYPIATKKLGLPDERYAELGFVVPDEVPGHLEEVYYKVLTRAWKDILNERRKGRQAVIEELADTGFTHDSLRYFKEFDAEELVVA